MGQTYAKWVNNNLVFYDSVTHEEVQPIAPILFEDDFVGADVVIPAVAAVESGCKWGKKIVLTAGSPTVAKVADGANGIVQCALDVTNEKQNADLTMADQRTFSVEQGLIVEMRIRMTVLPTLLAEIVWGVVGDWADGYDAITYSAFFTADGSGEVFCEVDDNATNSSATSGVTATAAQTKIYRIDFTDVTDVKFYIDGARVASGTTFPYAATGANAVLQPIVGCYKSTGAGLGTVQCDYVRIWGQRS